MIRYTLWRLISAYETIIVIDAILSWVPRGQYGFVDSIRSALDAIVNPFVDLFRRFIPPMGGLDISPMVAILALSLLQRLL
jgi:uncharacterized protein YggT (Ycf19 family)